jgi:hypothetical protein
MWINNTEWKQITFHNWQSITDRRDDQIDSGLTKGILGFMGAGLVDLPIQR